MDTPKKPNRTMARDTLYVDPAKFELLKQLSDSTRIPRADLLREAVDDLLAKHGKLKAPKAPKRSK